VLQIWLLVSFAYVIRFMCWLFLRILSDVSACVCWLCVCILPDVFNGEFCRLYLIYCLTVVILCCRLFMRINNTTNQWIGLDGTGRIGWMDWMGQGATFGKYTGRLAPWSWSWPRGLNRSNEYSVYSFSKVIASRCPASMIY
jgi:hypothetical protein